ncbi:probable salivary secreted peptide [Cryptotermes secundus]|uniref:probable salivary secreted peptide n=1 Tax=Cryptotermes secundus TaxID=105785 RepID=UPI000CD7C190|nr:probable salivary secreted peptide [Cryptotermes secundus]
MQLKVVLVVVLLALVQLAALHNNHNLAVGWRECGDRLLYRERVQQKFKFLGTRTAYLHYPSLGISNSTITYILALNESRGGYASVLGGGVGRTYVTLRFRSGFSRGIKFVVEIYGK